MKIKFIVLFLLFLLLLLYLHEKCAQLLCTKMALLCTKQIFKQKSPKTDGCRNVMLQINQKKI